MGYTDTDIFQRVTRMDVRLDQIRHDLHAVRQQLGMCKGKEVHNLSANIPTAHVTSRIKEHASFRRHRRQCVHKKVKLKAKKAKRQIRHDVKVAVSKAASTQTGEPKIDPHINPMVDFIFQKYMESVKRKTISKLKMTELKHVLSDHDSFSAISEFLSDKIPTKEGKDTVDPYLLKRHLLQNYLPNKKGDVAGSFHPMTLEEHFSNYRSETENVPSAQTATSMNIEMLRLETFKTFPLLSKARPIHLAKFGFFYTGRGETVECFSCKVRHSDWTETDKVFEVHRRISPSCRFIHNEDDTNVPITPPHGSEGNSSEVLENQNSPNTESNGSGTAQRDVQTTDGSQNTSRRSHLDGNVLPGNLLQNTQNANLDPAGPDQGHWGQGQSQIRGESDPAIASLSIYNRPQSSGTPSHSSLNSTNQSSSQSPNSPVSSLTNTNNSNRTGLSIQTSTTFPTGTSGSNNQTNDNAASSSSGVNTSPSTTPSTVSTSHPDPSSRQAVIQRLDPLGINFDRPRYPAYAILTVRISSFQNWPSHMTQTPRQMAMAGFLYAGYGDYARCFFCGGGLRNWEAGDDPWVEHARWFPRCAFLRQNKGDQFVALVQEQHHEEVRERVCFVNLLVK